MRHIALLALVFVLGTACLCISYKGSVSTVPIEVDQGRLTELVKREFPDGPPFASDGNPTDLDQARRFWEAVAAWPIDMSGDISYVSTQLWRVENETGLPIFLDAHAQAHLWRLTAPKRTVCFHAGAAQVISSLTGLQGAFRQQVSPYGLLVSASVDEAAPRFRQQTAPRIVWNAKDLEARIAERFPSGRPFDENGAPTNYKEAEAYWQLLVEQPLQVEGKPLDSLDTLVAISSTTGLPIFTNSCARLSFEPSRGSTTLESVLQDAVKRGTVHVTAYGVIIEERWLTFRWREDKDARIKEAFPQGYDPTSATQEERERLWRTVLDARCDLIVPEGICLSDFVEWLATASDGNFVIEAAALQSPPPGHAQAVIEPPIPEEEKNAPALIIQPFVARFARYEDAISMALESLDLTAVPGRVGLHIVPRGTPKEQLDEIQREGL